MRSECHPLKYIVQKTCFYVNYVQIFTCFQIVTHSVSKSWLWLCCYLGLYLGNLAFYGKFERNQNICMLNMFTFDECSVCHSLSQSVTGMTYFGLYLGNIAFHRDLIKYRLFVCLICSDLMCVQCHSLSQSITGMTLFIFLLILGNIGFPRKFYNIQNICFLLQRSIKNH